jgi:hypothetical protein
MAKILRSRLRKSLFGKRGNLISLDDPFSLFGDLDRFLRGRGFALFNLYGPKSDRHGVLLWANAIYTRADPSCLQREIK